LAIVADAASEPADESLSREVMGDQTLSADERKAVRFELSVQKSRALVYNLAWLIGVAGKTLGLLTFSWPEAILFLIIANISTSALAVLYSRGVTRLAGLSLRPIWMTFDILIITWAVYLSGGSQSAWYPWYLTNAAAAAYFSGRRGMVVVMAANVVAYLGLILLTENPSAGVLIEVVGKMTILFGAAGYALLAISRLQEKRRMISDLRSDESRRATELETAITTITTSADRLSRAADELSEVSQAMNASAGDTAKRAGTVSVAADQVSSNVHLVAAAVEELSAGVREIARSADKAARVAKEAVGVALDAESTVAKLGQSSVEISGVIETITSIADQTRLLALNATIEAARAGRAGRGFAVVADEVKKLAHATAVATEDIGGKITTIQTDADAAVAAIERIAGIVTQIHDLQATIADAVEEQTATTQEISSGVADAAQGGSEIAEGISAVAEAAEQTSLGAASVRDAARELAEMADDLKTDRRPG
jgi:methyl-accepting chemotaxis protein